MTDRPPEARFRARPEARFCIFLEKGAEEAARFYAATLPDTRVEQIHPIGPDRSMVLWSCMGASCMLMDGNAGFEARHDHSIAVATLDQAETDRLWSALTEGGEEGPCGWLCDRFGVHWQLVPTALTDMLGDADRAAAGRAQAAMMRMKKIDIAALRTAFEEGRAPRRSAGAGVS